MKRTLSEYITWLNSMTIAELIKEFPGEFKNPTEWPLESDQTKISFANTYALWRKVITYNKELIANPPAKCHCSKDTKMVRLSSGVHCMVCGCLI